MAGRDDGNSAYGHKAFKRSRSHFADRITADGRDGRPVEAGRHRLGPHHRERLGGRPFGDGTPPGPVRPGEEVPPRGRA